MSGYFLRPERPGKRADNARPAIAGTKSGKAIVCGSGRSLWDDLDRLGDHGGDVVAVNLAGCFLDKAPEHWCCIDTVGFQWLLPLRNGAVWQSDGRLQVGQGIETHSLHPGAGVKHTWEFPRSGSSGLFAVRVALALGYAPVIVCGIPLDQNGHFYDPPGYRQPTDHSESIGSWQGAVRSEFNGRVFGMSGATRRILGAP